MHELSVVCVLPLFLTQPKKLSSDVAKYLHDGFSVARLAVALSDVSSVKLTFL